MFFRKSFVYASLHACAVCALGFAVPASAQTLLPPTVVVANRLEQPLTDVVADVSIIDRAAIEASGATGVADLLATLPGIELARNGGVGNTTSVFIRGAETRHVAVLIDGVRIDTQTTGGATWNAIPLALIDRIEVVRGPAAAVYGSDAIAGAVQIFTRRGEAQWRPDAEIAVGSDGLRRARAAVAGRQEAWDAALTIGGERSDGFDVQPAANPDRDGYRSRALSASLGWAVAEGHRLEATVLDQQLKAEYDESQTAEDWGLHDLRTMGLRWTAQWSAQQRSEVALGRGTDRYYVTRPQLYLTKTAVTTALVRHEWQQGAQRWQLLLERREDDLRDSRLNASAGRARRHQNAAGVSWGWQQAAHTLQVNLRHDDDSEFGANATGSASYAWAFAPGWKVRFGIGSAFRAPTLFQRFSEYGSPALRPERARSAETALAYQRGGYAAEAVAYHSRVKDRIDFVEPDACQSSCGRYENVGRARLRGVSLRAAMPVANGRVQVSLDWSDPQNAVTGQRLARRAARAAKLQWTYPLASGRLGVQWQAYDHRYDYNRRRLGGYGVVDLSWQQPLARDWFVLARVDNVGDKAYQTALGYPTGGRRLYVGLQWRPR